jgi:hypothetical protein
LAPVPDESDQIVEADVAADLNMMLGVLQDDIRHVHVRVTAAIGIAAVFVTQIPLGDLRSQPDWARRLTVAGIVALAFSAAFYFQYTQQVNKLRLKIVADYTGSRLGAIPYTWNERFEARPGWNDRSVWLFRLGQAFLLVGTVCVGIVLVQLVAFS